MVKPVRVSIIKKMAIWVEPRNIVPISSEELVGIFYFRKTGPVVRVARQISPKDAP
jgi:hypothetical protein